MPELHLLFIRTWVSVNAYVSAGGILMIPLMMLSTLMWGLILNRLMVFRRLQSRPLTPQAAGALIRGNRLPGSERTDILSVLVRDYLKRRKQLYPNNRPARAEAGSYLLDETVVWMVRKLDRYLSLIAVMAGMAPLMGLLGTVVGMIATFESIARFGAGNIQGMAGGISEALITTQTGLLVAIPGLYMAQFLSRRSENLKHRVASAGIFLKPFCEKSAEEAQ